MTNTLAEALKPCPFCGEPPTSEQGERWVIACENSKCHAHPIVVIASTEIAAAQKWNRRSAYAALSGTELSEETIRGIALRDAETRAALHGQTAEKPWEFEKPPEWIKRYSAITEHTLTEAIRILTAHGITLTAPAKEK